MLGADGSSSGHVAGTGTGVDGTGLYKSNAVRRFAGAASGGRDTNGAIGSSIVRLPKAIAMFASRACRVSSLLLIVLLAKQIARFTYFSSLILRWKYMQQKSIMIGTALSHKEQREILKKLEKTDDPWTCAHGRVRLVS
jgi:hypothetical protein